MTELLQKLEPMLLQPNQIICSEEEQSELVTFIRGVRGQDGTSELKKFFIGYSYRRNGLNFRSFYPLKFGPHRPIGDYSATFSRQSAYTAMSESSAMALFIRPRAWTDILTKGNVDVVHSLKKSISTYHKEIQTKLDLRKRADKMRAHKGGYEVEFKIDPPPIDLACEGNDDCGVHTKCAHHYEYEQVGDKLECRVIGTMQAILEKVGELQSERDLYK